MPALEVIQEKLKKLQAQADVLIAKKAQSALNQIRRLMLDHGLTTDDIEEKAKAKHEAKGASSSGGAIKRKSSNALGTKVVAKFQDPKSGATWTGRGSAPAWIAKAKDRTKFLIQSDAVAAHVTSADAKNANATATAKPRGYRTGPQPAKYQDRKSGATWSGKGRAPAWLANAKDRTKFLIDEKGGSSDAKVVKAARRAPAEKVVGSKKVTRKVAAKSPDVANPVSKKAATVKKAAKKVTPTKSVASGKKIAAKKSGPAAKKRVPKKVFETGNAAESSTVGEAFSDTIEASAE